MNFPPAFLEELRDRVSLAEVAGRSLVWDKGKSKPARGDYWARCPFHNEKSASFHIEDRKGFYYCFGCHAKGDVIRFVMETANLSFPEAIERLALDAGMAIPERDPAAAERAQARDGLAEIMEAAVRFGRSQLRGAAGRAARDYLDGRGLSGATIDAFHIGYAPGSGSVMHDHLVQAGHAPAKIEEAGLSARREDGSFYDRFRDRILFPIRDPRGRCIAFGGRAMSEHAKAKYLNSPETPLFSKSRTLFNHGPARQAAGRGGPLTVVEGYMDVIALAQAGFKAVVAPLGTAVTEDHLRMLWRMADEPVIALDGDEAGLRAARRAADLALPLLAPGKSLRFAPMPPGKDPDDVVRSEGAGALRAILERAEPLVGLIWRGETEGRVFDTPERRGALDARLRAICDTVGDPGLREHYSRDFRARRDALFAPPPRQHRGGDKRFARGGERPAPYRAAEATRRSAPARRDDSGLEKLEQAVINGLLAQPEAIERLESTLSALEFDSPALDSIRGALLFTYAEALERGAVPTSALLRTSVEKRLGRQAFAALDRHGDGQQGDDHPKHTGAAHADTALDQALDRLVAVHALRRERDDARDVFQEEGGETAYNRLREAQIAYDAAMKSGAATADNSDDDAFARINAVYASSRVRQ